MTWGRGRVREKAGLVSGAGQGTWEGGFGSWGRGRAREKGGTSFWGGAGTREGWGWLLGARPGTWEAGVGFWGRGLGGRRLSGPTWSCLYATCAHLTLWNSFLWAVCLTLAEHLGKTLMVHSDCFPVCPCDCW